MTGSYLRVQLLLISCICVFSFSLKAQVSNEKFSESISEESSENEYVVDHVTVYPSETIGSRNVNCSCWIDPDETYTEADIVNGQFNIMDDGSTNNLPFPFDLELFGTIYSSFWININGHITFDGLPSDFYIAEDFPTNRAMLTPAFADLDLSCSTCGEIFFKITEDAVYINWVDAGYFPQSSDQVNNFQIIFTSSDNQLLGDGNNVQFCYKDMQWVDTGSSTVVKTGASAGNGTDFIQFGVFGQENSSNYDGPFGANDGIDWLDNKTLTFNSSLTSNENTPPISVGASECDTITLCVDDTEVIDLSFLAPETSQNIEITVNDGGYTNYTSQITDGAIASASFTISSNGVAPGIYPFEITATDNGTPVGSTTTSLIIEVLNETLPDLDVYFEDDITTSYSFCQGQDAPTLSGTDGFDCYLWTNGSSEQEDVFNQGVYYLSAFYLGCEAITGPVSVFEIPTFNPDVSVDDIFICEGETTEISIDNPEDYEAFEWAVYNLDGVIITEDLMSPTIEVTPGFYELIVTDENGCPGSRIVPVAEEILEIPSNSFDLFCDETEVNWSGGWTQPEDCAFFIYLYDDDGDTWEGANIAVYIDGTGPLNFNIANGAGFLPTGFEAYNGQFIQYEFSPGLDDDDINVSIFECGNNTPVFDSSLPEDELTEGVFFVQNAFTDVNAIPGLWTTSNEDGVYSDPEVYNPNGGTQTYSVPDGYVGCDTLTFISEEVCNLNQSFEVCFSTGPSISAPALLTGCSDTGVEITPTVEPQSIVDNLFFDWTPNGDCDGNPTCTITTSGTYLVSVELCDITSTATIEVELIQTPTANLSDFILCDGESQELNPGLTDVSFNYSWTENNAEFSTTPTVSVNESGAYTVSVSNECGNVSASSDVTTANTPSVQYWATDTLICPGEIALIDPIWNNGNGLDDPVSWSMSWTDEFGNPASESFTTTGESFNFGSELIPLDALTSGVFVNYSTSTLCGTASGNVLAYTDACFIGAYNVITPDADGGEGSLVQNGFLSGRGLNEGWQILGIDGLPNVSVRIYDRWGQLVYENDSYKNSEPWNGDHSNGSALEDGVYFYTIDTPRTESAFEGTVTIFRKN